MAPPANSRACRVADCGNLATLAGLCDLHASEDRTSRENRDMALRLLHFGQVEGRCPADKKLRSELDDLREWWFRACNSVNTGSQDEVLLDEAEYALEWCIRLAEQIGLAELSLRAGDSVPVSLQSTSRWVWERFTNLEAGLASNGVSRRG